MCLLSNDIYDYNFVSQGKITIPNVDDGEECTLTDVSREQNYTKYTPLDCEFFFEAFWFLYVF